MIITHVGGPTVLIEVDGWRLLTDPTFDPAGGHYDFGWGTSSDKLAGPAMAASAMPPIDAVLLTHDHHGDNLDTAGRALLPSVKTVITTTSEAAMTIDVALVHMGGVRFPVTGPVRYTMTGRKAVELLGIARPRVAVPVHYEGWGHFKDGRSAVERALTTAPDDIRRRVRWLPMGSPQHLE